MGDLSPKLHSSQLEVRAAILRSQSSRFVLEIARRWGKTYLLACMAIEACIQNPGGRVVYGAPTLKHLAEFILPTFETIISDAPADVRPEWRASDGHWRFPNGSHIHLFGADDKRKAARGRGSDAVLAIFDEAGFTPVLEYVLNDVLRWQLQRPGHEREGMMLLGSTPSDEVGHAFTRIAETEELSGNYARRTIYDNPRLSSEKVARIIAEGARQAGMSEEEYLASPEWRREGLAERITDRRLTAVPEWAESEGKYLKRIERPKWFDAYVTQDPGGVDPHFVGFGYLHFGLNALVIERELVFRNGENTEQIAEAIKATERELYGETCHDGTLRGVRDEGVRLPPWLMIEAAKHDRAQPYLRISDTNTQLINDLHQLHGLAFIPTEKTDKALHVNNLRIGIRQGRLYVDPRCVHTDRHLKTTLWKDHRRTEFVRKNGEHGDGVDMLSYKFRNVNWGRNPEPPGWKLNPHKHHIPPELEESEDNGLRKAFTF